MSQGTYDQDTESEYTTFPDLSSNVEFPDLPNFLTEENPNMLEDEFDDDDIEFLAAAFADLNQDDLDEFEVDDEVITIGKRNEFNDLADENVKTGKITFKETPTGYIRPGFKRKREFSRTQFLHCDEYRAFSEKGIIYLAGKKQGMRANNVPIGVCHTVARSKLLRIDHTDLVGKLGIWNEEVGGKGARMGFSSAYHAMACLCIGKGGIIEPKNGFDVSINNITIEITGHNFKHRTTSADWVINKYALLEGITNDKDTTMEHMRKLSLAEDRCDVSGFHGTSFDSGENSPYTDNLQKMHEYVRGMTREQISGIELFHLRYYKETLQESVGIDKDTTGISNSPLGEKRTLKGMNNLVNNYNELKDTTAIDKYLYNDRTLKRNGFVPSPFKALMFEPDEVVDTEELYRRQHINVDVLNYVDDTSFHTYPVDGDYKKDVSGHAVHRLLYKHEDAKLEVKIRHYMNTFLTFQAAEIESELLGKICGRRGNFYSKFSNIGIAWDLKGAKLLYKCCFYSFVKPVYDKRFIGDWEYDEKDDVYRSPVFKTSHGFNKFACVLPRRMLNVINATHCLIQNKDFLNLSESFMTLFSLWRWSTWETTRITGNSRYITTGHTNKTSDMQHLVDSALTSDKYITFPNFVYARLCKEYAETTNKNHMKTPLLGFPLSLMALEKDLPLGMYWHINQRKHYVGCMTKVIKAHRMEIEQRSERIACQKRQLLFMNKLREKGVEYSDYRNLMDSMPDFPHFNAITFIGLTNICKDDLVGVGSSQQSTEFSYLNMVSGHNNLEIIQPNLEYRSNKVFKTMKVLPKVRGAHELIIELNNQKDKIEHIMSVHPKDQKSGNRDIEQMHIKYRPYQLLRESMIGVVSSALPADHMKDPTKHVSFVNEFTSIMRSKDNKLLTSEDRSFHSGYNYPEEMALAYHIIGKITGNTSVICAASVQSLNRHRDLIFPDAYDFNDEQARQDLNGLEVNGGLFWKRQLKRVPVKKIRMYSHFLQGIDVVGASVINSIKSTSDLKICDRILFGLKDTAVVVTSDDVGKAITIKRGYDQEFMGYAALIFPLKQLNTVMMKNNEKKFSCVKNAIEINNTCITRTGMVAQTPINAVLLNQPLSNLSIIADLITVVSGARSTIFWGDTPSLAMSSLYGGLLQLKQKWLITEDELTFLTDIGLIPDCSADLVSGFFPRNKRLFQYFKSLCNEEQLTKVRNGVISFLSPATTKYMVKLNKKQIPKDKYPNMPRLARKNAESIRLEMNLGGRMNLMWSGHPPFKKRSLMKNKFIKDIRNYMSSGAEVTKETNDLFQLLRPPEITEIFQRLRRSHTLPTQMGHSTTHLKPDLQSIRCMRFLGCDYRIKSDNKYKDLNDEEFDEFENTLRIQTDKEGMSFTSPSGLPSVKILNNTQYRHSTVYSFIAELKSQFKALEIEEPVYYHNGIEVERFKPSEWSNVFLNDVKEEMEERGLFAAKLSFGYGKLDNAYYAFTCNNAKKPNDRVIQIHKLGYDLGKIQRIGDFFLIEPNIFVCVNTDYSPLDPSEYEVNFDSQLTGIRGDPIAIYNYKGYSRSNASNAFETYRQIFRKFNSYIPSELRRFLPNFPNTKYRTREPSVLSGATGYILQGSNCIYNVDLKFDGKRQMEKKYNLDGTIPKELTIKTKSRRRMIKKLEEIEEVEEFNEEELIEELLEENNLQEENFEW